MEKPTIYAKAAFVLSILAFFLSFFPLATVGAVYVRSASFYTVLIVGIVTYFPTVVLGLACDVLAGDTSETRLAERSGIWATLFASLSDGLGGRQRVRVTMKSPASAWLARSGIALVLQMVLILIGLFVFVPPSSAHR